MNRRTAKIPGLAAAHRVICPLVKGEWATQWFSLSGREQPVISDTPPEPGSVAVGWGLLGARCQAHDWDDIFESAAYELPDDAEERIDALPPGQTKGRLIAALASSYRPVPVPENAGPCVIDSSLSRR
jgi:hypothetical protein